MRWFMDTEFAEDGRTIELISIALVNENGGFYYAVSKEFDPAKCNPWVRENVLPKLPPLEPGNFWKTRTEIAADVRDLLVGDRPENEPAQKPEIWGYFADYDWVVFCQLFGRMVDLPRGMPFFCRDLKQHMETYGVRKEELPRQDTAGEHDALADARWIRTAWIEVERLRRLPQRPVQAA